MQEQHRKSKFHHYVPKFIINGFAQRKKKQYYVNVFDKQTRRNFQANTLDVFGENEFNRIRIEEKEICTEDITADFDNMAAPVIRKVIANQSIRNLDEEEINNILLLIAFQFNRGAGPRKMYDDVFAQIRRSLASKVGESDLPLEISQFDCSDKRKLFNMVFALDAVKEIVEVLSKKTILLMHATTGKLLLGDNPVVLSNSLPCSESRSNLGLGCVGIEIYMPISPGLVIALWCPKILEMMRSELDSNAAHAKKLTGMQTIVLPALSPQIKASVAELNERTRILEEIIEAVSHDDAVSLSADSLLHQNSLQIASAERYVVSSDGNFRDLEEMLDSDASFLRGRRMVVV